MKVKLISMQEHVALVEYVDPPATYRRVIVPAVAIAGNEASEQVLFEGIAYGTDWAQLIGVSDINVVDVRGEIANELHRRGLWLREDLLRKPDEVKSACMAVAAMICAALLREAKNNGTK